MIVFALVLIALVWWMIYDHALFVQQFDHTEAVWSNNFCRELEMKKKVVDAKLFHRRYGSYVVEVH